MGNYSIKKVMNLFATDLNRNTLIKAEEAGNIPSPARQQTGSIQRRVWRTEDLPPIGELYGFLKKPARPSVITVFNMKGGVLKTTLSLNLARLTALHNIKTCVIGLDLQGDISTALGFNSDIEDSGNLEEAVERVQKTPGLFSWVSQKPKVSLDRLLLDTDIPTLKFIPETPELVQLDQAVNLMNNRDFWLKEQIIEPLQKRFDLIILDCSPNWNRLVTNALVACDLLVSPLECKINNFRNYSVFAPFIAEFKKAFPRDSALKFQHVYLPTRFTPTRKLSSEIRSWYLGNVAGCLHGVIRESASGEDATAMQLSLPEFAPTSLAADEMRGVITEIWGRLLPYTEREQAVSQP
jgi:chromosome partitioning protein